MEVEQYKNSEISATAESIRIVVRILNVIFASGLALMCAGWFIQGADKLLPALLLVGLCITLLLSIDFNAENIESFVTKKNIIKTSNSSAASTLACFCLIGFIYLGILNLVNTLPSLVWFGLEYVDDPYTEWYKVFPWNELVQGVLFLGIGLSLLRGQNSRLSWIFSSTKLEVTSSHSLIAVMIGGFYLIQGIADVFQYAIVGLDWYRNPEKVEAVFGAQHQYNIIYALLQCTAAFIVIKYRQSFVDRFRSFEVTA